MTIFGQLTERQQQALEGGKADSGTRKALASRGLIAPDDMGGFQTVTLTDKGRLVLLQHAQCDNKPAQFSPGDEAVAFRSYLQGAKFPVIHAERVTVLQVHENGVIECSGAMSTERHFAYHLAHLADAEAYGVMGVVR